MRTLVTGGAGFIGSHLCERLLKRKDEVWCVDNLRLGRRHNIAHLESLPGPRFIKFDVLDSTTLTALFADARFDAVFHMAANSDIAAGTADMKIDLELNYLSTVAVLKAMQALNVKQIFFASSSAIFGETDVRCCTRTSRPCPPYRTMVQVSLRLNLIFLRSHISPEAVPSYCVFRTLLASMPLTALFMIFSVN